MDHMLSFWGRSPSTSWGMGMGTDHTPHGQWRAGIRPPFRRRASAGANAARQGSVDGDPCRERWMEAHGAAAFLARYLPRISGRIPWWPGWCGATGQGARSGRPKARLEACPASGLAGVEMMKVSPVPACRPVLTRTVAGPVAAWTGASARRHRDGLAGSEFRRFSCLVRGSEPCSTLPTSMVSESEHREGTRLITAPKSADGSPTTGTCGTWTRLAEPAPSVIAIAGRPPTTEQPPWN